MAICHTVETCYEQSNFILSKIIFFSTIWNDIQNIKKKKEKSREESKYLIPRKQVDHETFHQVLPMIVSTGVHVTWEWTVAHIK